MTRQETRDIREAALEDDSLTANARLLLSFIVDWHHKKKGCVMHDSTLGDRLGMSERTVQRRRKELTEAGYLAEEHGAHRRELIPKQGNPSKMPDDSSVESHDTGDVSGDTSDETGDSSVGQAHDTSDVDREINNPEGASSRARTGKSRWAFLPSYRMRHLREIKQEAGGPEEQADVLDIATRYLGGSQESLASIVDHHREQRPDDQVIAAYVIAGREADSPMEYADKIIREGWKDAGGSEVPSPARLEERFGDKDVIHFGSTR